MNVILLCVSFLNSTPDYHSCNFISATLVDITGDLPVAKIQRSILSLFLTCQQYLTHLVIPPVEIHSLINFQNNTSPFSGQ